jgi:hypothetical protein
MLTEKDFYDYFAEETISIGFVSTQKPEEPDFEFEVINWYSRRIKLSHSLVQKISEDSDIVDCLMSAGGSAIVAAGLLAAPAVALIAALIKLELLLIKRLDKGKGVYLINYIGSAFIWIPSSVT